jgi:hypothetical protein
MHSDRSLAVGVALLGRIDQLPIGSSKACFGEA